MVIKIDWILLSGAELADRKSLFFHFPKLRRQFIIMLIAIICIYSPEVSLTWSLAKMGTPPENHDVKLL